MDDTLLLPARPAAGQGALLTDLYELTMLQAYFDEGLDATASFELFIRALPKGRNFLVAAGLGEVLDYLAGLRFTPADLRWLRATKRFSRPFLASLEGLRFTGDVDAMPEGTVFFPDEPVVRITAPLREAQLVESRLMNLAHYETLVASKAARCVLAANGRMLVDFGLRRSHGAEAALLSARASYLAGFTGTATVEAGRRWGVPVFGTMAHSYVQVHGDESEAFERFALAHRGSATLLIDTYDTERAARRIVSLAPKLQAKGVAINGVRLDSGDLANHARRVRAILDDGGLEDVAIFASGNLDEHRLAELVASGAPIDGFGVGTRMNTSADAPWLDCAYKLQEYAGEPRRKRSEGKATWPGRKQVYRRYDAEGRFAGDTLTLVDEPQAGEALLLPVVRSGLLIRPPVPLAESRALANRQVSRLPLRLKSLEPADPPYPVAVTDGLKRLASQLDARS